MNDNIQFTGDVRTTRRLTALVVILLLLALPGLVAVSMVVWGIGLLVKCIQLLGELRR